MSRLHRIPVFSAAGALLCAGWAALFASSCAQHSDRDHYVEKAYPVEDLAALARRDSSAVHIAVQSALQLTPPVTVAWMGKFEDGGSIAGTLRDATGKRLDFAWDGARRDPGAPEYSAPRHAFLGKRRFADLGSRRLLVGSTEERALLLALHHFIVRAERPSAAVRRDGVARTDWSWRMGVARTLVGRLELQRNDGAEGRFAPRPYPRERQSLARRVKRRLLDD